MYNPKVACLCISAFAFLAGSLAGSTAVQNSWRLDAAQTSCAQFNPQYGQFEWLEVTE
jgi:hypothetical protein|tara:strand:- start:170 stop:343 length:174 start_codon:yes stop_codon:yes gene_type:complete